MTDYLLEASAATPTHVPREWYDSQRAALARAEGQVIGLQALNTELLKRIEKLSSPRNGAGPSEAMVAAKTQAKMQAPPKAQAKIKAPEIEIEF